MTSQVAAFVAVFAVALLMGCTFQLDASPDAINISKVGDSVDDAVPKIVNLAVIGDLSDDLNVVLESASGRSIINQFTVFGKGQIRAGSLTNFSVALVSRENVTRGTRTELTRFIESGGSIIIVQKGAYFEDDQLVPWNTDFGAYLPVTASISIIDVEPLNTFEFEGRLVPSPGVPEENIFKGYIISESKSWTLYDVISRPGAEEVGFIESSSEAGFILKKAIIKKTNSGAGNSLYFAYNPAKESPALLLNAIDSLR